MHVTVVAIVSHMAADIAVMCVNTHGEIVQQGFVKESDGLTRWFEMMLSTFGLVDADSEGEENEDEEF